ncbi:MAG TPA: formimidoylglutamase [candidate division Zixibacteria bacterium]|nr:formimidoylglutamase [candidate division Zixibacteria bacterium]
MNIFSLTTRLDTSWFFKFHDPNDKKLGDIVTYLEKDYKRSKYVLLGCPQDEGVKRNHGRPGAAEAPNEIRKCFYKFSVPASLKSGCLFDAGNTILGETLEETHDTQTKIVEQIIRDGKKLIVLGGGNDISYPDCAGLAAVSKKLLAFNIDSHFDVRKNKVRNSGTPYRQLLEENKIEPKNFFELAIQPFANSEIYLNYLEKKRVKLFTLELFRQKGIAKTLRTILKSNKSKSIFWGIDMDSVRSSDAPGVSASYPTGLTAEELLLIASIAGNDKRSAVVEISEVNPKHDVDSRTCKLAALAILKFLETVSI